MTEQTQLGVQNPKRSPAKVRQLSAEDLGIPTGTEETQGEEAAWEELRSKAEDVASEENSGVAVRTDDGDIETAASLSEGVSRDVHALELAVWKAYDAHSSSVTDVAIMTSDGGYPCGRCLQVVADYGESVVLQVIADDGFDETSLSELLENPYS
jgi:cytidine deaminase